MRHLERDGSQFKHMLIRWSTNGNVLTANGASLGK